MSIELKIKHKHLALEPGIIRIEEKKLKRRMKYHRGEGTNAFELDWKLQSLINHRRIQVRNEARATHLARTYLQGKPYKFAELKRRADGEFNFIKNILTRVQVMVQKYGKGEQRKVTLDTLKEWSMQ